MTNSTERLGSDMWQPISTAPKDGSLVLLRSPRYAPNQPFWWDQAKSQWATWVFAVARKLPAWWAEDEEQPTEWRPVPEADHAD